MRSRRYRYYDDENYTEDCNKILLAEFMFYNKTKNIIKNDTLTKLCNELLSQSPIYWTNNEYAKIGIGFKLIREKNESYISLKSFDNPINKEDFCKSTFIYGKCMFIFQIEESEKIIIREIFRNNCDNFILFETWEDVYSFIIKNSNCFNRLNNLTREQFKILSEILFGEDIIKNYYDIDDNLILKYNVNTNGYSQSDVYHLIDVIEKRVNDTNYRILISYESYDHELHICLVSEHDPWYNECDKNRLWFIKNNNKYFLHEDNTKYDIDNSINIELNVFHYLAKDLNEIIDKNTYLITPSIYRFYEDKVVKFNKNKNRYDLNPQEQAIIDKYLLILNQGKKIIINQTIIEKNSITIEGVFKLTFDENFIDMTTVFVDLKKVLEDDNIRYNFNELYDRVIALSNMRYIDRQYTGDHRYTQIKPIKINVNGVDVEVIRDETRMKINGIFSRIDDVKYIVAKAVCCDTTEDFNKYVKDVSHIGVRWIKLLNHGIIIKLVNPFHTMYKKIGLDSHVEPKIRFSMSWDSERRRNVYLLLNNNKYLIKYKGKFLQHFDRASLRASISELKSKLSDCIENLDDVMLINIVENAVKEAEIIQERGEALVKETVNDIKATKSEIVYEGRTHNGYLFIGMKSGKEYFVENETLYVYKKEDGKWNRKCVVDDYKKQRIYEDRLANRLINIFNEPARIYTL